MAPEADGRGIETLKDDLARLHTDLMEVARGLEQFAATPPAARGLSRLQQVFGQAQEALGGARERGRAAVEAVEGRVREHPLAALVAVFGTGFLLGKLLGRR